MIDEKPPCPSHGIRMMARGRGGGMTAKFGTWYRCGLCAFKIFVSAMDDHVVQTSTLATIWIFYLAVHLH